MPILKKGAQTFSPDANFWQDKKLVKQYRAAGWELSDAGTEALPLFYEDGEGALQQRDVPLSEYWETIGVGGGGEYLTGTAATDARSAIEKQRLEAARLERASGFEGDLNALAQGIVSTVPGMTNLVESLTTEGQHRFMESAREANPIAHTVGLGGAMLGQYLATGGAAALSGTSTLGRLGASLNRVTLGGATRTAGQVLGRATGATGGRVAGIAGTVIGEELMASAHMDLNQVLAGREDFVAENILANMGTSALLGLGVEGTLRGIGKAFTKVKGAGRRGIGALDAAMDAPTAQRSVDVDSFRAQLDSADDPVAVITRELEETRAAVETETARAIAMRDATASMQASGVLETTAASVASKASKAMARLRDSLTGPLSPSARKATLAESSLIGIKAVDVKSPVVSRLANIEASLAGIGKQVGVSDVKRAVIKAKQAINTGKSTPDIYGALLEAQDDIGAAFDRLNLRSDRVSTGALSLQEDVRKLVQDGTLWGDITQLREAQQMSLMEFRQAARQVMKVPEGRSLNLRDLTLKEKPLARQFKSLKDGTLGSDFDSLAQALASMRPLTDDVGTIRLIDEALVDLVKANHAAGLHAAMNTLGKQSDVIGKDIATLRSMKGVIGAGGIGMMAGGGLGGLAAAGAATALAKPLNQVRVKAFLEGVFSDSATKFSRGIERVKRSLRGTRPVAVRSVMSMNREQRKKEYERIREDNIKFMQNPLDSVDALGTLVEPLTEASYDVAQAIQTGVVNRQSYIQQIIPEPIVDRFTGKIKAYPSDAELSDFMKRIEVVDDPLVLLERFADGTLTAGMVEAAQMTSPELYADMLSSIAEVAVGIATDGTHIPYASRVNLSQSFGINIDDTLSASFTLAMQSTAAQTEEQDIAINGATRPVSTRKPSLPENTQTTTDRISN